MTRSALMLLLVVPAASLVANVKPEPLWSEIQKGDWEEGDNAWASAAYAHVGTHSAFKHLPENVQWRAYERIMQVPEQDRQDEFEWIKSKLEDLSATLSPAELASEEKVLKVLDAGDEDVPTME